MIHNESVNVWTHLLGAAIVLILIFYTGIFFQHQTEFITNFDFSKITEEIKELSKPILPK